MGQAIRLAVQVVGVMVLARLLTPRDFGLVAMVTAVIGFVALFREMGLITATVQARTIEPGQLSALFWLNLGLGVLAALLIFAAAPLLAAGYGEPALLGITIGLALAHPISGACVQHRALLRRNLRIPREVAIDVVAALTSMIGAIGIALAGGGYWALVALPVLNALVAAVLLWTLAPYRPSRPAWSPGVGRLLQFGGSLTAAGAIGYWARNADRALLGWRWGAATVGYYSKALQLVSLTAGQITTSLWDAVVPTLSRIQDEPERFARYCSRILSAVLWGVSVIAGLLVAAPEAVVLVALGPQWAEAAPIARIAALTIPAQAICSISGWVLASLGRGGLILKLFALTTPLVILVLWLGLPHGAIGMVRSLASAQIFIVLPLTVATTIQASPLDLGAFFRSTVWPLVAGIAAGTGAWLAVRATGLPPSLLSLLVAAAGGAVGLGVLLLVARPARREIATIVGMLRMALKR